MKKPVLTLLASLLFLALQAQNGQQITLEDIFTKGTFRAETVRGLRSMNDGEHYTTQEGRSKIVKNSYRSGQQVEVLFDLEKIDDAPISSFSDYEFSEDETKVCTTGRFPSSTPRYLLTGPPGGDNFTETFLSSVSPRPSRPAVTLECAVYIIAITPLIFS